MLEKSTTSVLREKIKPENMMQKETINPDYSEMIVTTYEGPHANFYTVSAPFTTIGRSPKNSITVLEESACKNHAEIIRHKGRFFVKDLGSKSGTFIKVFNKEELKVGMIIEMGSFQFTITAVNQFSSSISLTAQNLNDSETSTSQFDISLADKKKTFSFGRKDSNDFHFDDQHLSGLHAKI